MNKKLNTKCTFTVILHFFATLILLFSLGLCACSSHISDMIEVIPVTPASTPTQTPESTPTQTNTHITLLPGPSINEILYCFCNSTKFLPSATLTTQNILYNIAQTDSQPVYIWEDNNEKITYYYAEGYTDSNPPVKKIPLPQNSSEIFKGLK